MTQTSKVVQFGVGGVRFKAEVHFGKQPKWDKVQATLVSGHLSRSREYELEFWRALLDAVRRFLRSLTKAVTPMGTDTLNPTMQAEPVSA